MQDNIFMKFLYLLLSSTLFYCGWEEPPEPVIPDRELKEIVIYGNYYPQEG